MKQKIKNHFIPKEKKIRGLIFFSDIELQNS